MTELSDDRVFGLMPKLVEALLMPEGPERAAMLEADPELRDAVERFGTDRARSWGLGSEFVVGAWDYQVTRIEDDLVTVAVADSPQIAFTVPCAWVDRLFGPCPACEAVGELILDQSTHRLRAAMELRKRSTARRRGTAT